MGVATVDLPEPRDPTLGEGDKPYSLPGRGVGHAECERPLLIGHSSESGEFHYIRLPHRGCRSYDCPQNVLKGKRWGNRWLRREAAVVSSALPALVVHAIVSPPNDHEAGPCPAPKTPGVLRKYRAKAYAVLRAAYPNRKLRGACFVHPERCVPRARDSGIEGLHFHFALAPPGPFDGRSVKRTHARTGWVMKVIGVRRGLPLISYELHHVARWLRRSSVQLNLYLERSERTAPLGGADDTGGAAAPTYPAPTANSRYETEAVTWLGDRSELTEDPAADPELATWCPFCRRWVLQADWEPFTYCGPPDTYPSASSGIVPRSCVETARERAFKRWEAA